MRRDDIPAGLRLCRAANWNQLAADWEVFLTSSPGGCRVAVNNAGDVIGSVATIRYGDAFSWIAMVLVDPSCRRLGIGSMLLNASLESLNDVATIRLDATPAGHEVYVRCGFREEYGLHRMQRSAAARGMQASSGETGLVRRMADTDLAEVFVLDLAAFGADRRTLLEMFRHEAPEYARVTGGDRIDGYVFGRHGFAFEHIGPLVARDETAARQLVTACLAARPDRPFIIDVPLHATWIDWLESRQFTRQRPFIRMCRGEQRVQERLDQMFAIAGPEFG